MVYYPLVAGVAPMESDNQLEIVTIWNEAKACVDEGNFDKAIEIYGYVLLRYEDNQVAVESANAFLGDVYLTLGRLDLAESHTQKAISLNPEKPDYHYLLGFVYSTQSQWRKAVKEFKFAIKASPDNAEYLRGLGLALLNIGDRIKSMQLLHKANELAPSNLNILLDLANAYFITLDFKNARMYADRALLVDPANKLAQNILSKIEVIQKMNMQSKEWR
jgi:tetratricopeptide (TPR) repeat protein